jgi:hypothetical protein
MWSDTTRVQRMGQGYGEYQANQVSQHRAAWCEADADDVMRPWQCNECIAADKTQRCHS